MRVLILISVCFILLPGCKFSQLPENTTYKELGSPSSSQTEFVLTNEPVIQAIPFDRNFYDELFIQAIDINKDLGKIRGAIVPHHMVGGNIPATLFKYLSKQKPSTIVIFGPNHLQKGDSSVISAISDWNTPYGRVKTERDILTTLYQNNSAKDDLNTMAGEYSIGALVSFIANYLPETKIVPLIFPYNAPTSSLDKMLDTLLEIVPDDGVFISSIDFSHYQNPAVASFHDELNRSVVRNFDYARLDKMEIDSIPSLYCLWKSLEKINARKIVYEMTGSSDLQLNNPEFEETTSYYSPYFADGNPIEEKSASILFFGDLMLDRSVKNQIDKNGADFVFEKLAGEEDRFFKGADLIHANLEGPFANSRRATSKEIAFRFDPLLIPILKKYNFGIFSQANNHSFDMGTAGFAESSENLKNAGFDVYGNQYIIDNNSLIIKHVGNFNIAFIGINDTNSPVDLPALKSLIKKGDDNADFVLINIHWGQEYKEISNSRQRFLAHELIDAGGDAIIGHHPHVVQEMEIYNNRPIFYSLGNFIFDQYFSLPTQQGLAVGLVLKEKSISTYVFPLQQEKSQPRQMTYAERMKYFDNWIIDCRLSDNIFSNLSLTINL